MSAAVGRLDDIERELIRVRGSILRGGDLDGWFMVEQDALVDAVERIVCQRVVRERECIAQRIEDAALHVMGNADSAEGAKLTAAILQRAANIAREGLQ